MTHVPAAFNLVKCRASFRFKGFSFLTLARVALSDLRADGKIKESQHFIPPPERSMVISCRFIKAVDELIIGRWHQLVDTAAICTLNFSYNLCDWWLMVVRTWSTSIEIDIQAQFNNSISLVSNWVFWTNISSRGTPLGSICILSCRLNPGYTHSNYKTCYRNSEQSLPSTSYSSVVPNLFCSRAIYFFWRAWGPQG